MLMIVAIVVETVTLFGLLLALAIQSSVLDATRRCLEEANELLAEEYEYASELLAEIGKLEKKVKQ